MRKENKCFRLTDLLGYTSEIGPPENIIAAIKVLCGDTSVPEAPKHKPSRGTADDAICISDDEDDPVGEIKGEPVVDEKVPFACADDETSTSITLKELLECLRREELNEVAKAFRVKTTFKVSFALSKSKA